MKPLKPKLHWDLMLEMVFRCNSSYFRSLIIFMDGLPLDNDFWTRFPYFFYSYCCCCRFVLLCFVLPFYYYFIFFFLLFLILLLILLLSYYHYYYGYYCYYLLNLFLLFMAMLGYFSVSPIFSLLVLSFMFVTCLPGYVTFYYCFALGTTFFPINS